MNNFQGFVGYGIKELYSDEITKYCNNLSESKNTLPLKSKYKLNFTHNFSLRTFTTGCYYYDLSNYKWVSSLDMEIKNTTDFSMTYCLTNHLTSFAGGLVVLPNTINFQYVWAHASYIDNPIIYTSVIVITILYSILAVIVRIVDLQDKKRLTLSFLSDNSLHDSYFYEIITFTGILPESGTDSKVNV